MVLDVEALEEVAVVATASHAAVLTIKRIKRQRSTCELHNVLIIDF